MDGAQAAQAQDQTRRQFVRSLSAGALLASGGVGAGSTAGAEEDRAAASVTRVVEWDLRTERIDESEVKAEPAVAFDGETVIVTGSKVFSQTGCDTFEVGRIAFRDPGQLDVEVDAVSTRSEEALCADALMPLRYELEVVPEGIAQAVTVDETFSDADPVSNYRDEWPSIELPDVVTDYEFSVEHDLDPSAVEEAEGPSIAFEGEQIVVEGSLVYGSPLCTDVVLEDVSSAANDHVDAVVAPRQDLTADPEVFCPDDLAAASYRLVLTTEEETVTLATATERGHRTTERQAALRDGSTHWSGGIREADVRLTFEDGADEVERAPTVLPRLGGQYGVVRIEGAIDSDPGCAEPAIADVRYEESSDEQELVVTVGAQTLPDVYCSPEPTVPTSYTIDLLVDDLPPLFTAEEMISMEQGALRSVTARTASCASATSVDGQSVCDVDGDGEYRDVTGDGSVTNADVTTFFGNQHLPAWDERTGLFDFDGDENVGQADVVELFASVTGQ